MLLEKEQAQNEKKMSSKDKLGVLPFFFGIQYSLRSVIGLVNIL